MSEKKPISDAPKDGTIIIVGSGNIEASMFWNKRAKRWEGKTLGIIGPRKTWWDESHTPLEHWRAA